MTRIEAIAEQHRLFPHKPGHGPALTLPEICLAVRQSINGAADPWPTDRLRDVLAMLAGRLATWEVNPVTDGSVAAIEARIDEAVRAMVTVTVDLIDLTAPWNYE